MGICFSMMRITNKHALCKEGTKITTKETFLLSTYFPKIIAELLPLVPSDHWVMMIGYQSGGVAADAQIGVTGKAKVGENIDIAMARELAEELGWFPVDWCLGAVPAKVVDHVTDRTIHRGYVIDASSLTKATKKNTVHFSHSLDIDDHKTKVVGIVHGTKDDCMKILMNANATTDNISYHQMIHISEALKISRFMMKQHNARERSCTLEWQIRE